MRTFYYISCLLIRVGLRICWRYRRTGAEHVPKIGGLIIAANHAAYVDPPFIGSVCPRELCYLAKAELFSNALFGWLIRKYNAIPVTRGVFDRRAITQAVKLLKEGKALLFFPEGTRSRDGSFLEPKLGLGMIAKEAEVPVVPAYISNSGDLWRSLLKRKRMIIGFGAPIYPDWLADIPKDKDGYRIIGQEIMKHIGALKGKIEIEGF